MGPLGVLVTLAAAAAAYFVLMQLFKYFNRLDMDSSTALMLQLEDPNSITPLPCPSIWSPATKQLSIIIPAYNEEDRLPGTLDETLGYLQRRRNKQGPAFTYEVIIVDDGSKDNTAAVALGYVKSQGIDAVRLLKLPHNCGKGRAVREGMLIARGQSCLFMDADGATRVSDMELLEAALADVASSKDSTVSKDSKAAATIPSTAGSSTGVLAAAVGSRAHLEQEALAKRHPLRNFLMHGFHMLVVFVAGSAVKDTQCGFKMFSRHAAALLYSNQRLQRWCFDVELLYLCSRLGIPVKEVQVGLKLCCCVVEGLLWIAARGLCACDA
jgi:dolichyl-phosphate beta-glucosyltransferase